MKAYQIVDADFVKREIGRMPIVNDATAAADRPIPKRHQHSARCGRRLGRSAERWPPGVQDSNSIFPGLRSSCTPDGRACQDRRLPGVGGLQWKLTYLYAGIIFDFGCHPRASRGNFVGCLRERRRREERRRQPDRASGAADNGFRRDEAMTRAGCLSVAGGPFAVP